MTDPHDEQSSTTDEPITTERREFLRSLGNRKNLGFELTSPHPDQTAGTFPASL